MESRWRWACIRRGTPDRTVVRCGGESERKSGNAGSAVGMDAARGGCAESCATRRSIPLPALRLRPLGTSPGGTEKGTGFEPLKTQALAYDRDLFNHTLVLSDGHFAVQRVGQGFSLC